MPCYSLYGQVIETCEDFDDCLPRTIKSPNLTYKKIVDIFPQPWGNVQTLYRSPYLTENQEPRMVIQQRGSTFRAVLAGAAIFELTRSSIVCYPEFDSSPEQINGLLLSTIFSLWLEWQGYIALHASGVIVNEKTVAFLAASQGGKSTLAASFLKAGYPLMTDDILPIRRTHDANVIAYPGYPQIRLWPDEAKYFLGDYHQLPLVHPDVTKRQVRIDPDFFGNFYNKQLPLGCIFIPEIRRGTQDTRILITPLSKRAALVKLIQGSFAVYLVEKMGFARQRLAHLSYLTGSLSVKHLSYPSGLEHMPSIRQAILDDLIYGEAG